MDQSRFSPQAPGSIEQIKVQIGAEWVTDWAFVPEPVATDFSLPTALWPLLMKAKEELARLDGVGRHLPNQDLLIRPLQQREALTSSSLEGTFATAEQLLLYGIDPIDPASEKDPVNAWKEVFNYGRSLTLGRRSLDGGYPISLMLIRQLHKELLTGVRGSDQTPGEFRQKQVHIGSTRRFVPPPPLRVQQCLTELETYLKLESDLDPLIRCFLVHYQFETIHPFLDGNGRLGRLLISLYLASQGLLVKPALYLSDYFERNKTAYVDHLMAVRQGNHMRAWLVFFLHGIEETAQASAGVFRNILALKERIERETLPRFSTRRQHNAQRLMRMLYARPVVDVKAVAASLDTTPNTASALIRDLVDGAVLVEMTGQRRNRLFLFKEYMALFRE